MSSRSLAALLALACLAGPNLVQAQTPQYATVLAAAEALKLTTLISAIQAANLTNLFENPNLMAIVLAPTNAAFAALDSSLLGASSEISTSLETSESSDSSLEASEASLETSSDAVKPLDNLALILSYHVLYQDTEYGTLPTDRIVSFPSYLDGMLDTTGLNMTLTNVTINPINGSAYLAAMSPGGMTNLSMSVTAGMSTVYLIDSVLLPPSSLLTPGFPLTVAEAALNTTALSTLAALIEADPEIMGLLSMTDVDFTIFAPTDAALAKLLSELNTTADEILGTTLANRVLKNHVVTARPFTAAQFPAGNSTYATAFPGDSLIVSRASSLGGNETYAVTVTSPGSTASVTATALAGKSVIHIIDTVMLPSLSPPGFPGPPSTAPLPPGSSGPGSSAAGIPTSSTTIIAAAAGAALLMLSLKL